jgi:uncharacterized integral membrane protein
MSEPTTPPPDPERTAAQPAAPETSSEPTSTRDPLRGSRTSGFWFGVVGLALLLLLLIIFIAQNTEKVNVAFLGWDGQTPLAVALLIAALAGLVVAVVAGSLRILQLRRRVKHG